MLTFTRVVFVDGEPTMHKYPKAISNASYMDVNKDISNYFVNEAVWYSGVFSELTAVFDWWYQEARDSEKPVTMTFMNGADAHIWHWAP